jgi:hypothetical protein
VTWFLTKNLYQCCSIYCSYLIWPWVAVYVFLKQKPILNHLKTLRAMWWQCWQISLQIISGNVSSLPDILKWMYEIRRQILRIWSYY